MNAQDSENERNRLRAFYSAKSDGELEQLAQDMQSLTPQARQVLEEEIARRHMEVAPASPAMPEAEPEFRELVTIRQFRDLPEALLAKGMLDSVGIETFLADDNIVRMDWFISNMIGGIRLRVRPKDVESAEDVLSQPILAEFSYDGGAEYEQPRCPKCGSLNSTTDYWQGAAAPVMVSSEEPGAASRESWTCLTCGTQWVDDEGKKS